MIRFLKKPVGFVAARKVLSLVLLTVIVIIAVVVLFHPFSWFSNASKKVVVAGNPVPAPAVAKSTTPARKSPGGSGNLVAGSATDTRGSVSGSNDPSKWVSSASGVITVKSPAAGSHLSSGDVIAGTAKVRQISYRLKDNRVGKIAEGTLEVVNGKFSGTINFTPQGTGGQLDIFTTDAMGIEYNEVQINVAF